MAEPLDFYDPAPREPLSAAIREVPAEQWPSDAELVVATAQQHDPIYLDIHLMYCHQDTVVERLWFGFSGCARRFLDYGVGVWYSPQVVRNDEGAESILPDALYEDKVLTGEAVQMASQRLDQSIPPSTWAPYEAGYRGIVEIDLDVNVVPAGNWIALQMRSPHQARPDEPQYKTIDFFGNVNLIFPRALFINPFAQALVRTYRK